VAVGLLMLNHVSTTRACSVSGLSDPCVKATMVLVELDLWFIGKFWKHLAFEYSVFSVRNRFECVFFGPVVKKILHNLMIWKERASVARTFRWHDMSCFRREMVYSQCCAYDCDGIVSYDATALHFWRQPRQPFRNPRSTSFLGETSRQKLVRAP